MQKSNTIKRNWKILFCFEIDTRISKVEIEIYTAISQRKGQVTYISES